MTVRLTAFLLAFSMTLSCGSGDEQQQVMFGKYLDEVFSTEIEEALYILVPMNSCDGCRQIVYRNLLASEVQKSIKVVLIGEVQEALTLNYINRLSGKGIDVLRDPQEKVLQYDLLVEDYPMIHITFIDVLVGKVVSFNVLKPNMINGEVDIRREIFKSYIK